MKRSHLIICLLLLALLLMAVPVTAGITKISPAAGYTGKTTTVTITGSNLTTDGDVWLEMSGEDDIDAYDIVSWTNTSIVCKFRIPSDTKTGNWNLVVRDEDDLETDERFTILNSITLTSISPTSARMDDDEVDFTIIGTGLKYIDDVILYNNDYDNISAVDVVLISSTKLEGTFDLTDTDEDTYDVCVVDDYGTEECDLSFEITTDEVGSIEISSSPAGASIYVDGSYIGTTPDTAEDLEEGSYKVVLRKSGYNDWGKIVKVTAGDTSTVDADLDVIRTTAPTAVPTTVPTTVRTTVKKSTLTVPTTWPSATPTPASPVDPVVIIGAVGLGLGFVVLRKP